MKYSKKLITLFICISCITAVLFADNDLSDNMIIDQEPTLTIENAVSEDAISEDTATQVVVSEDTTAEDTAAQVVVSEDTTAEDTAAQVVESEDAAAEDTAAQVVVSEDATSSEKTTITAEQQLQPESTKIANQQISQEPHEPVVESNAHPIIAPIFKNISAVTKGNSIVITWTETNLATVSRVVLFRSTEPITESSILNAKVIARIPTGKKIYTDKVTDNIDYYYGLMAENEKGAVTFIYSPLDNTTTKGISITLPEVTVMADITSLDAQAKDNTVVVRYSTSKQGSRLILYRSTSPLTNPANLTGAVIVSVFTDNGAPFIDYPIQGIPCYYGLIDEEAVRKGIANFTAGVNATIVPVYTTGESPVRKDTSVSMRNIPLPYLTMPGITMPEPKRIDPETERIIHALIEKSTQNTLTIQDVKDIYLFPDEQKERAIGESSLLIGIIRRNFTQKQWNTAATEILKFLELRRSDAVTARARFYLGETYFFSGMYREALTEFLFSRSLYYAQSQEWVQYTLNKLDTVPRKK